MNRELVLQHPSAEATCRRCHRPLSGHHRAVTRLYCRRLNGRPNLTLEALGLGDARSPEALRVLAGCSRLCRQQGCPPLPSPR